MSNRSTFLKSFRLLVLVWACLWSYSEAAEKADDLPISARMVLAEAGELMEKKAYRRAVETLTEFQGRGKRITKLDEPDPQGYHHPMIYYFLGNCYLLQKNYPQAEKALLQAVTRDPGFVEVWVNLAKTYHEQQSYRKAAQCFATAYEKSDQSTPDNLYCCAVGYLMADETGPSVAAFQRLFENHPDRITMQWREYFVQALIAADQPRRALPLIRKLTEQSSGEGKTKWQEILLYQYLQLDMRTEALAYATELTRGECATAKWWKALAHVELSDGRGEEALAALTIYGYLTPLSAQEKKLWADLNLQLNIPARAVSQYQEIMKDDPNPGTLQNLILAYQKLDRYEEALDQLARYAPDAENADLLMLKADLLYALKRYPEAKDAYRQVAQSKSSKSGQAWLMAGYAAWWSDDITAGRHAFKKAAGDSRYRKAATLAMQQMVR